MNLENVKLRYRVYADWEFWPTKETGSQEIAIAILNSDAIELREIAKEAVIDEAILSVNHDDIIERRVFKVRIKRIDYEGYEL